MVKSLWYEFLKSTGAKHLSDKEKLEKKNKTPKIQIAPINYSN